jgi:hypothetical protein
MCHIERTPGKEEGAQVNFKHELTKVLRKHVSVNYKHLCVTGSINMITLFSKSFFLNNVYLHHLNVITEIELNLHHNR